MDDDILYLTPKGNYHPVKVSQINPKLHSYTVTSPTGATDKHNKQQLKPLDYMAIPRAQVIPRPHLVKLKVVCNPTCYPMYHLT